MAGARDRVPLSLYIHVPFCHYRCRYCNFTLETGWSDGLLDRTLSLIVSEAHALVEHAAKNGLDWEFRTLYVGGGTPSVIPPDKIVRFFADLKASLGLPSAFRFEESTFELNPEDVTAELLGALKESGVDRLSLGVQTFDTDRLQLLGRWCDRQKNIQALDLIARGWQSTWTVDLMTGLPGSSERPGQTWVELREGLEALLSYDPPHISLYSLIVEPGTELKTQLDRKKLRPLSPTVQDQLWIRAAETLQNAGLRWYEVSNFAKPGHESKHNAVYWRLDPYAGLGAGAAGTLPERNAAGQLRPVRTQKPKLFPWLAGEVQEERLTPAEFFFEHFLAGLRTEVGVSLGRLKTVFGSKAVDWATDWGTSLVSLGDLLVDTPGRLVLTQRGRLKLDRILTEMGDPDPGMFPVDWNWDRFF